MNFMGYFRLLLILLPLRLVNQDMMAADGDLVVASAVFICARMYREFAS